MMTEPPEFSLAVVVELALVGMLQGAFHLPACIRLCEQKQMAGREVPRGDKVLFTRNSCNTACRFCQ